LQTEGLEKPKMGEENYRKGKVVLEGKRKRQIGVELCLKHLTNEGRGAPKR